MTHRMMILMIQLGLIVFAARMGCMLFTKLKLPGVLGELFAGMLIGPYLLGGMVLPGLGHGLFPLGSHFPLSPELYGICSFAAVILLFVVGLETDLKLFLRFSVTGTLVGVGGVVASFLVGDLVTIMLSEMVFGQQLGFFAPQCLFLGVLSTATSVGITARVLSDKRKLDSPEGVTILAGAVIDDVLGIILLAIVLGMITASRATGIVDWGRIGIIAIKAVGIWLAATFLGLAFSRRISGLLKWFRDKTSIAVMALGLALVVAGMFEEAGLAMIIGAYVTGLSLSQTDIRRLIQEKLDPVYRLLVPVFFCSMGMLVDFRALASWPVLLFGSVYTITSVVSKIAGCSIPAFFSKFNLRGSARIGMGMVPRGEVALIIAGIGLSSNVLGPEAFGVAVMMTAITTMAAPVLLVQLFKNPAPGTRQAVDTGEESTLRYEFPTLEIADLMISKINDAFANEGFYIHSLEHEDYDLFQLLKDDIMISLHRQDCDIVFRCNQRDQHLIAAAVYEVLGEFRQMINELNKPIDQAEIQRKMHAGNQNGNGRRLDLAEYIRPSAVIPEMEAETKRGVIEELLDLLCETGDLSNREEILKLLLEREDLVSTGMENGIAFPHAKSDSVDRIVAAVGIKTEGIDFDSLDGKPCKIFVLEIAPASATGPHLQFMSTISQVLDENTCAKLLEKSLSSAQIHAILTTS